MKWEEDREGGSAGSSGKTREKWSEGRKEIEGGARSRREANLLNLRDRSGEAKKKRKRGHVYHLLVTR